MGFRWVLNKKKKVEYKITFVSFVCNDEIRIINGTDDLQKNLIEVGAVKDTKEEEWILHGNTEKELAENFSRLRDMGVAFSTGKEWSPDELFRYYREKGLLSGTYKKINFWGPNDYYITEGN